MRTGRTGAFAAPLADRRVLVAGGQNETPYLSSAEIFALDATPQKMMSVSNACSFFATGTGRIDTEGRRALWETLGLSIRDEQGAAADS